MTRLTSFFESSFEWLTNKLNTILGHSYSFFIALLIIVSWIAYDVIDKKAVHDLLNDLFVGFTFLMVFIIQKSQNKFSTGIHLKLNELVASQENASNRLIKVEDRSEAELKKLDVHYQDLANTVGKQDEMTSSKSIEQIISEKDETKDDSIEK